MRCVVAIRYAQVTRHRFDEFVRDRSVHIAKVISDPCVPISVSHVLTATGRIASSSRVCVGRRIEPRRGENDVKDVVRPHCLKAVLNRRFYISVVIRLAQQPV